MNKPPRCYTCGSPGANSTKECCRMRKIAYISDERRDLISLVYSTTKDTLENRFTTTDDAQPSLPERNCGALTELLKSANIPILQRLVDLRKE